MSRDVTITAYKLTNSKVPGLGPVSTVHSSFEGGWEFMTICDAAYSRYAERDTLEFNGKNSALWQITLTFQELLEIYNASDYEKNVNYNPDYDRLYMEYLEKCEELCGGYDEQVRMVMEGITIDHPEFECDGNGDAFADFMHTPDIEKKIAFITIYNWQ